MSDVAFLPQLLTLHQSLLVQPGCFRLTVLCMDSASLRFLRRANLAGVELLELADLERADPRLRPTRSGRTWTEYCWTVTPALCCHALERAADDAVVVWVDADVEFVRDPERLADALADGSVLLTPHRYSRAYPTAAPATYLTARYGRFNGGTVGFRRDEQGLAAARLWRERTLAWCWDRCEPGRFGNQLHLDDFPHRFPRARVLPVPGGILGPWNGGRFAVHRSAGGPRADARPVIAYHYQSLRLAHARPRVARWLSPNVFALTVRQLPIEAHAQPHYRLSRGERRCFWRPHVARLSRAVSRVLADEPAFAASLARAPARETVIAGIQRSWSLRAGAWLLPYHRLLAVRYPRWLRKRSVSCLGPTPRR